MKTTCTGEENIQTIVDHRHEIPWWLENTPPSLLSDAVEGRVEQVRLEPC